MRNPNRYAIFDARVSLALNSLQKKYGIEDAVLFPHLPTQNRMFVKATQTVVSSSGFFKSTLGNNFYHFYLNLLDSAVKDSGEFDLQDAEMILFANAKEFSEVWH